MHRTASTEEVRKPIQISEFTLYLDLEEWIVTADHRGSPRAASRVFVSEAGVLPPSGTYRGQLRLQDGETADVTVAVCPPDVRVSARKLVLEADSVPRLPLGTAALVVTHAFMQDGSSAASNALAPIRGTPPPLMQGDRRSETPDPDRFKAAMSRFATGVAIVTALEGSDPVGFTCQSLISLSLDPPLVALAPAKTSTSWPRIAKGGTFCVNLLSQDQLELCYRFAKSGAQKYKAVDWVPGRLGDPTLPGALASLECRLEITHDAGDHEIVIGRVVEIELNDGEPLVYYRRSFRRLAET